MRQFEVRKGIEMFLTKESANFFFLIYVILFALPFGITIGLIVNVLMRKIFNEAKWKIVPLILDMIMGVAGFLIGTMVAFIGYSSKEEWYNGKLVLRQTTGFGDYYLLFEIAGAALLTAIAHLSVKLARDILMRRSRNPLNLK